jgi:hypothetical protein
MRGVQHTVLSDPVNSLVKCRGSMGHTTLYCAGKVGFLVLVQLRVKIDGTLYAELSAGRQLGRAGSPIYVRSAPTRCAPSYISEDAIPGHFASLSSTDTFAACAGRSCLVFSDTFNTIAWIQQNFFWSKGNYNDLFRFQVILFLWTPRTLIYIRKTKTELS